MLALALALVVALIVRPGTTARIAEAPGATDTRRIEGRTGLRARPLNTRRRRALSGVRPTCDLEALKYSVCKTWQQKNACKWGHSADRVTPSLPGIQHRQHEKRICSTFQAL